jgi:hypothetical protein
MKHPMLAKVLLAGLTGLSLTVGPRRDAPVSDVGTLDKRQRKGLSAKRAYSPWAGRNFPPAALRRHPPPHRVFV